MKGLKNTLLIPVEKLKIFIKWYLKFKVHLKTFPSFFQNIYKCFKIGRDELLLIILLEKGNKAERLIFACNTELV